MTMMLWTRQSVSIGEIGLLMGVGNVLCNVVYWAKYMVVIVLIFYGLIQYMQQEIGHLHHGFRKYFVNGKTFYRKS